VWRYEGPDEPEGYGLKLVRHAQGTRVMFEDKQHCMPRSVERLEDAILNGRVLIDASPVTSTCAANAVLITDAQKNRAFDKKRSRGRIDDLVTIAMAVGAATAHEAEPQVSVYDRMAADEAGGELAPARLPAGQVGEHGIDYAVLQDPAHPLFAMMKTRFDEHQALHDDEEF
jgi:hypothetical protein